MKNSSMNNLGVLILPDEIECISKIGEGAFSSVFKGSWNGTNVVLKWYDRLEPDSQKIFLNEVEVLSKLWHPNVILYLGHLIEDSYYTIVLEEMNGNIHKEILEDF